VEVLVGEGPGGGAPGGVGWVVVATWIVVGGGEGPRGTGGGAGAVVMAGCVWGNRADRRGSLVEATPPLRCATRGSSTSALWHITGSGGRCTIGHGRG
jgi:hypothetical protein